MIQFKKLILHNFGSYNHAEIDLQSRGFCLVSGKNNFKKDNALSNGSGKSFLWSAISYALTGETINGVKSNLKNIFIDENSCYTSVLFNFEKDAYEITRIIAPKPDLKLIKNGENVSGKGLRESEKKLGELLPDLSKDLLASTIIIGQGFPNRFSSFSPSGRKELLEKLTKADFMIEDIRQRVYQRQDVIQKEIRECEDSLLIHNTEHQADLRALSNLQTEFSNLKPLDWQAEISSTEKTIADFKNTLVETDKNIIEIDTLLDEVQQKLLEETTKKANLITQETEEYNKLRSELSTKKAKLEAQVYTLNREINKIMAIKDICPTCGQKIPNVQKPSVDKETQELQGLTNMLTPLNEQLYVCDNQHNYKQKEIKASFDSVLSNLRNQQSDLKKQKSDLQDLKNDVSHYLQLENDKLLRLTYERDTYLEHHNGLLTNINNLKNKILKQESLIDDISTVKSDLAAHQTVLKKMEILIKRDFRGYLLSNIIEYINQKAKDYSEIVFETRDLDVYLDGNSLDIAYCGKMFDSLSGGEKQRVDLILQFAIRNMLSQYLDLSANIIVLDEITDFLDKKSCKAVMNLLEKELNTTESVFIISHHAEELELPIDSEIKILKNSDGISEVVN